jgi:molybdopterin-binding protein
MRLSARNMLKGTVKQVIPGVVNSEVTIELLGGIEVVSIITRTSAEGLGLAPGKGVRRHRGMKCIPRRRTSWWRSIDDANAANRIAPVWAGTPCLPTRTFLRTPWPKAPSPG